MAGCLENSEPSHHKSNDHPEKEIPPSKLLPRHEFSEKTVRPFAFYLGGILMFSEVHAQTPDLTLPEVIQKIDRQNATLQPRKIHHGHFDMDIDPIQQGARNFLSILFNRPRPATALTFRIAVVAARVWASF
jgi:hypothetical protein